MATCAIFAAAIVAVFFEIIFLHRTIVSVGSLGVMGEQPPWGFPGTLRPDLLRMDSGAPFWQAQPWTRAIRRAYAEARLPLWNADQGFGAPLAANAQSGAFDPLRLPTILKTGPRGWDAYYLLRALLGLVLAYGFAAAVGLAWPARLLFSLCFVFSGFMLLLVDNTYIEIYYLCPALLWATELLIRGRALLGLLGLAAAVALSTLAGMPEATLMTFVVAAPYGAFRCAAVALAARDARAGLRVAASLLVGWVAGLGLAAPLVLPLAEYIQLAFHVHPPDRLIGLAYLGLSAIGTHALPFLQVLPDSPAYHSLSLRSLGYSGAVVVFLALVGALGVRRGTLGSVAWFSLLAALGLLAKFFGVPLVNELGRLPAFNVTIIFIWGAPVLALLLALLASVGVHDLGRGTVGRGRLCLALALFLAYVGAALWLNWGLVVRTGPNHVIRTVGWPVTFVLWLWSLLLIARPRAGLSAGLGCLFAVGELLLLAPRNGYQDRYEPFAPPPYVELLQERARSEPPFRLFARQAYLHPNSAAAFDLADVRALDALYPERYFTYVDRLLTTGIFDRYTGFRPQDGVNPGPGRETGPEPRGITPLVGNRWLNLANVKYVVVPSGSPPAADSDLSSLILAANGGTKSGLAVGAFTIDGRTEAVLFEHPPASLGYRLRIPPEATGLYFDLALHPETWSPDHGDGVGFRVQVDAGGGPAEVFARTIDPKRDPADRRWIPASADLSPYAGRVVTLTLSTDPLADSRSDWAGWGNLRLAPADDRPQYRPIYRGEVDVWENLRAQPRAFLVGQVRPVADERAALAALEEPAFDPRSAAVVEADASLADGFGGRPGQAGSVEIHSYRDDRVELAVSAPARALLVLTDVFYPGWQAEVDGAPAPIYPTDLAFRGVVVEPGEHTVTFAYRPDSFRLGLLAAGVSLLLLAVAGRAIHQTGRRGEGGLP